MSEHAKALADAVHAAITRALDEASVRNEVLRGMCLEVGLETFTALASQQQAEPPVAYDQRPEVRLQRIQIAAIRWADTFHKLQPMHLSDCDVLEDLEMWLRGLGFEQPVDTATRKDVSPPPEPAHDKFVLQWSWYDDRSGSWSVVEAPTDCSGGMQEGQLLTVYEGQQMAPDATHVAGELYLKRSDGRWAASPSAAPPSAPASETGEALKIIEEYLVMARIQGSRTDCNRLIGDALELVRHVATSAPASELITAWMVERTTNADGAAWWFTGLLLKSERGPDYAIADFTKDPNGAVRYPTKAAAQFALDDLFWKRPRPVLDVTFYAVTEHQWLATSAPASEPTGPMETRKLKDGYASADNEPRDPERDAYLDYRGDDKGQGLDAYWKWGHAAGWNDHKKHVATSAPADPLSDAERDVLAERQRQIEVEGYARQHDVDMHDSGDLAAAAACYALHTEPVGNVGDYLRFWPWDGDAWKPKDRYRNYIRAAALLIAAADVERTRGSAVLAKNDRELLELAAKAEGHGVEFDEISGLTFWGDKFTGLLWNPLHHDGDALRLAVKLRLVLLLELPRIGIGPMLDGPEVYAEEGEDECAVTRRAIVLAAAQIGKAMP